MSLNYGGTESVSGTTGQLLKPRVADALGPSMRDARGVPICVRTPGDPTTQIIYRIPLDTGGFLVIPCVPLNLLAPAGSIPREQLQNLTFNDAGQGTDTMRAVVATARGRIAKLPNHGEISLSLGGEYRDEIGERFPPDVAGAGNTTDDGAYATRGQLDSLEGFSELTIVPISGHDIARWVELDLGARVLRHSRHGANLTYKAGGLFRTVHGIAVRGTYATAFRAPTVPDLFGGRTERTSSAEDPCDARPPSVGDGTKILDPTVQARCTAQGVPVDSKFNTSQQVAVLGGNPDLQAESATTATVGVVVEPPPIKGLALSADYPRYKANLSSTWAHPGGASGGFSLRFIGAYKECADNNCNSNLAMASRDVDRYVKLDLFGGYDVRSRIGRTTLQLGVNNLFDATPPVVYNAAAANSDAATYDFVGRLVYVRLSQAF